MSSHANPHAKPGPSDTINDNKTVTQQLRAYLQQTESQPRRKTGFPAVPTGWSDVDKTLAGDDDSVPARQLAGLRRGALHEWFVLPGRTTHNRDAFTPPLAVFIHLAQQTLAQAIAAGEPSATATNQSPTAKRNVWQHHDDLPLEVPLVLWVGRAVWPHPQALLRDDGRDRRLLDRSLFIDPPNPAAQTWAADVALRSAAAAVVIADARGLTMAGSRRWQLAAESSGALGLLARPPGEIKQLSVAATRWQINNLPVQGPHPRWRLELIRHKHAPAQAARHHAWQLEQHPQKGIVAVAADVVDRSLETQTTARRIA